jgi:thioredoxin-related protein
MRRIPILLFVFAVAGNIFADEARWLTSFAEAAEEASRERKLVLLDFTGSDWCGWCQRLEAETFSQRGFIEYADKNLVLVRVDFPKQKQQSGELKEANRALKSQFSVSGFPSVFIVKPNGSILWEQRGYLPGGPVAMVAEAEQCRKAAGLRRVTPTSGAAAAVIPRSATVPQPAPAPRPQNPGGEPKLQGIVYSSSHPTAMINGSICEVGDTVKGARVIKIERETVTVEYEGQTKVLQLN